MPFVKKTSPTPSEPLRVRKAREASEAKAAKKMAKVEAAIALAPQKIAKLRALQGNGSKAQAALIDPDKPLTANQREFVKFWAQGESLANAALKAGYADSSVAYRLARQPNILTLYYDEKKAYEASCQMTRKQVMDGLLEAIDFAKMVEEPASMISGWREVAKMCGYYEPVKVNITHSVDGKAVEDRLNSMSDEDLMKIVLDRANAIANGAQNAGNAGAPAP